MIKHVSESASAQLCEFSSGRCCVLCLEYMGMCLCAPGCFKISALLSSGTLIGKPLDFHLAMMVVVVMAVVVEW